MNNLIFVLFYSLLHFSGYSLYTNLTKNDGIDYKDKYQYQESFFPLISLFLIGNINIVLNFFVPIKLIALPLITIFILLAVYGLVLAFKRDVFKNSIINLFFIPFIVSFSSYGIKFHYDSGAYHLNYQNWIYENKITLGLANLNPYYSYGSIQEYIFSNLSYFNINLLFFFTELTFFTSFFIWIFKYLRQNNNIFLRNCSLFILMFLFLDNFGYLGGGNGSIQIQMVGKADTAVGIIWMLLSVIILNAFIEKDTNQNQFTLILIIGLLAFQLKSNAAPLIFIIILYIGFFRKKLILINLQNAIILIFLIAFLLKNFLVSGCVIYPLNFTCNKNISWLNYEHIYQSSFITLRDNKRLELGESFIQSINDFLNHSYNLQIYINFISSLLIIFIIKNIVFKKTSNKNLRTKLFFIVYVVFNFLLFFFTVPAFRNGYGLFLSSVIILTIDNLELKKTFRFLFNNMTFTLLFFLTIALFPRMFMYSEAINNNFSFLDFEAGKAKYKKVDELFTIPIDNNQCWYKSNCLLVTKYNNNILFKEKFGYTIISSSK